MLASSLCVSRCIGGFAKSLTLKDSATTFTCAQLTQNKEKKKEERGKHFMRVIYVPIVIPVNYRTLFSLVGSLLAASLLIYACASGRWNTASLTPNYNSATTGTSIVIFQGLQSINIDICSPTTVRTGIMQMCEMRHVIYSECDELSDPWCQGGNMFTASFGTIIASSVVLFLAVMVGFVREMMLGFILLVAGCVEILCAVTYLKGDQMATNGGLLPYLSKHAMSSGGHFSYGHSHAFYMFLAGVALTFLSAGLSLSLWCCAVHGEENRARHPPSVQMVRMDTNPDVEIAQSAPQPGFVRLSDGRFAVHENGDDEEDDDLGLVTSERDPQSAAAAVHRREVVVEYGDAPADPAKPGEDTAAVALAAKVPPEASTEAER